MGVRVPPSASISESTFPATSAEAGTTATDAPAPAADQAPPPVVAPPPGHPRFPLLDSLRAVAALCVVLTHTSFLSGSNERAWFGDYGARLGLGVTIFFLISGFLIYRPFVHSRLNGAPTTRLAEFLRRRALRIFPAYWAALTILAIKPGLPDVHSDRWWAYYGLFQAYDPSWYDKGIGTAWSLSTEVAFYLLLPLYAFAAARLLTGLARDRQVRIELLALAVLGVGSLVARVLVSDAERDAPFGQASTLPITIAGTFLWFALGMGLAVVSAALHRRAPGDEPRFVSFVARRPWVPWVAAAGLFVLVSKGIGISGARFQDLGPVQIGGEHVLDGAIALCLLLPAVFGDRAGGWPRRVLANRWLAMLGLISYGIFLWHLTIATKLSGEGLDGFVPLTLVTLAITIPVAAASYVLLERPLLRLKHRRAGGVPSRATST